MSEQYTKENSSEWHVAGLMIQCRPEKISAIKTALSAYSYTEVAAEDAEKGHLVVVMESHDQRDLLNKIENSRDIDGVIVVSLVYHEQDNQQL